jgi:hypothetical protein
LDSLKQTTQASVAKTLDFTPIMLGSPWIRFVFKFSNAAYPIGVTSPTYSASIKIQGVVAYNAVTVSGTPSVTISSGAITSTAAGDIAMDTVRVIHPIASGVVAYTNGDYFGQSTTAASCPALYFPNAARLTTGSGAGSGGYITYVSCVADSAYTGLSLQMGIYTDSIGMAYFADHAVYSPTFERRTKEVGTVTLSFTTQGTASAISAIAEWSGLLPYKCTAGSTALYGRVSAVNGTTIKLGGAFLFKVKYDRN